MIETLKARAIELRDRVDALSLRERAMVFIAVMVVLYAFEIVIVCIQAYIFMLITTMYLRDAVHAH